MTDILILGGYGNFGRRIAALLVKRDQAVIIAGRNAEKAKALARSLGERAAYSAFDINTQLGETLMELRPKVVINTCGPFQNADYTVAETCIENAVHYIDLADARDFVAGFGAVDAAARRAGVAAVTAASSVPCLSSAVLDYFQPQFSGIDSLIYGISPGQRADIGEATAASILNYAGKRLEPFPGGQHVFGWQNLYRQSYPIIGKRWMANCEIPDLDIFPERYDLKSMRFSAGIELAPVHFALWAVSWLIRAGIRPNLKRAVKPMLSIARALGRFGSDRSGMHMIIRGKGHEGEVKEIRWFLISEDGVGPFVAAVPAAIIAQRLVSDTSGLPPGAYNSAGLISLTDYLQALTHLPIRTITEDPSERTH